MLFNLSCEEVGAIHVSVDSENACVLAKWLEQEQEVAVDGIF